MAEAEHCSKPFIKCSYASRIKSILQKYHKIECAEDIKTKNNVLLNENFSNIQLINDFHHIKYDHNTNEDVNQFNLFNEYLFENKKNEIILPANRCSSSRSYYCRRNRRSNQVQENENINTLSAHLLDRIHTYFIHSYHRYQLTPQETNYIENKLNECKQQNPDILNDKKIEIICSVIDKKQKPSSYGLSDNRKYITSNNECLKFTKISLIL
eukprot:319200_1